MDGETNGQTNRNKQNTCRQYTQCTYIVYTLGTYVYTQYIYTYQHIYIVYIYIYIVYTQYIYACHTQYICISHMQYICIVCLLKSYEAVCVRCGQCKGRQVDGWMYIVHTYIIKYIPYIVYIQSIYTQYIFTICIRTIHTKYINTSKIKQLYVRCKPVTLKV